MRIKTQAYLSPQHAFLKALLKSLFGLSKISSNSCFYICWFLSLLKSLHCLPLHREINSSQSFLTDISPYPFLLHYLPPLTHSEFCTYSIPWFILSFPSGVVPPIPADTFQCILPYPGRMSSTWKNNLEHPHFYFPTCRTKPLSHNVGEHVTHHIIP